MTVLQTRPHATHAPAPGEPPRKLRWTWDDVIRMGEAGVLSAEARFELLDGEIYQLMPPGPLHAFLVSFIAELVDQLARGLGGHVREEKPIRLSAEYDPQPDVAVVRGPMHAYRDRFPTPQEVLLIVEVADSSLEHDRTLKLPAYAAYGIPECWLVNLPEQQVEVYRNPSSGGYALRLVLREGDSINPLADPDMAFAAAELLGITVPQQPS